MEEIGELCECARVGIAIIKNNPRIWGLFLFPIPLKAVLLFQRHQYRVDCHDIFWRIGAFSRADILVLICFVSLACYFDHVWCFAVEFGEAVIAFFVGGGNIRICEFFCFRIPLV